MRLDSTSRGNTLKRLNHRIVNRNNDVRHHFNMPMNTVIRDARQLLRNRNQPTFDARQLLSRPSPKMLGNSQFSEREFTQFEDNYIDCTQANRASTKYQIVRNISSTSDVSFEDDSDHDEHISLQDISSDELMSMTKTIINTEFDRVNDHDQYQRFDAKPLPSKDKLSISFVKDDYCNGPQSTSKRTSCSPPPTIRRLNDASIQTTDSSLRSQSPNRNDSIRKNVDKYGNYYEHLIEHTDNSKYSSKLHREDENSNTKLHLSRASTLDARAVLVTNLHSSITIDDVIELFSTIGSIDDIRILSRDCIQIVYSQREYAQQAAAKYHNQLFDGQLIYVSLQQTSSCSFSNNSLKSSTNDSSAEYIKAKTSDKKSSSSSLLSSNNRHQHSKSTSSTIVIDPIFMREALFNSSMDEKDPVRFRVKI